MQIYFIKDVIDGNITYVYKIRKIIFAPLFLVSNEKPKTNT